MSRIFELRIPTGISSQRQAGFPMLPSSCQPYDVHLYLQGSERTFEFMYTDYAEGLYRCRACVLLPKRSDRSLSFRLFLFWGARNKGQGSIIFSTFDAVPVPMQFFRFICHYYILKGFSFLFFLQKWSFFCKSGQFYSPVVFMTMKKALSAPFRQSFPYFLKKCDLK